MNLYEAMKKGPADPTPASIISTLESSVNVPSFMGHPYTCNHKIVPGNPAICSAAQRIIQYKDGKFTDIAGKWVDGASLVG
jgi:branched-chain amino acid transport system substrate-binding protein